MYIYGIGNTAIYVKKQHGLLMCIAWMKQQWHVLVWYVSGCCCGHFVCRDS
jgi:hypothetical protein